MVNMEMDHRAVEEMNLAEYMLIIKGRRSMAAMQEQQKREKEVVQVSSADDLDSIFEGNRPARRPLK